MTSATFEDCIVSCHDDFECSAVDINHTPSGFCNFFKSNGQGFLALNGKQTGAGQAAYKESKCQVNQK